jgi:uncharacterized membrane protein YciS (DUF1049 family)
MDTEPRPLDRRAVERIAYQAIGRQFRLPALFSLVLLIVGFVLGHLVAARHWQQSTSQFEHRLAQLNQRIEKQANRVRPELAQASATASRGMHVNVTPAWFDSQTLAPVLGRPTSVPPVDFLALSPVQGPATSPAEPRLPVVPISTEQPATIPATASAPPGAASLQPRPASQPAARDEQLISLPTIQLPAMESIPLPPMDEAASSMAIGEHTVSRSPAASTTWTGETTSARDVSPVQTTAKESVSIEAQEPAGQRAVQQVVAASLNEFRRHVREQFASLQLELQQDLDDCRRELAPYAERRRSLSAEQVGQILDRLHTEQTVRCQALLAQIERAVTSIEADSAQRTTAGEDSTGEDSTGDDSTGDDSDAANVQNAASPSDGASSLQIADADRALTAPSPVFLPLVNAEDPLTVGSELREAPAVGEASAAPAAGTAYRFLAPPRSPRGAMFFSPSQRRISQPDDSAAAR